LVDEDPAQARAAWVAARVAHYRDRRQARHANSRQNLQDQDKTAEQQRRASLCYLDVHRVAQRIVDERKPGVAPRVIRRIVRTMLDLSLVPTHDRIERRRLHARLRRLRKQTGLPLDPTLLR
jgi:hypothetical protein